jgi:hypothetical protein
MVKVNAVKDAAVYEMGVIWVAVWTLLELSFHTRFKFVTFPEFGTPVP